MGPVWVPVVSFLFRCGQKQQHLHTYPAHTSCLLRNCDPHSFCAIWFARFPGSLTLKESKNIRIENDSWTWIHSCCLAWFMQENWLVGGVDRKLGWWLVSDIELRKQTNPWWLLTSMWSGKVCLADKQWLAHSQGSRLPNWQPLHPQLLLLLHQCPMHIVASAHILALWARNAKNPDYCSPPCCCPARCFPPPPLSHCCSVSQLFYKPAGRAVWVAACISRDTVFDLMLHTVTWLLQSEAAMPAVRKRAEGHRPAHCSMLRSDEALRVGCGRLGWVFKSRLNVKSLTPWNVLVISVNRITR